MHKIPFSKKQYIELIKSVMAGNYVREVSLENEDKSSDHLDKLENYLLSFAKDYNLEKEFTEVYKNNLIVSDELDKEVEGMIDEYDNDIFWEQIKIRLGKRDFVESVTPEEEEKIIKNKGLLPDRIFKIYDKYEDEFIKHGIENLRIINKDVLKKL